LTGSPWCAEWPALQGQCDTYLAAVGQYGTSFRTRLVSGESTYCP
jgi:hypothetical protein